MTHVELSLTDAAAVLRPHPATGPWPGLDRWASVAADALEPCLVLDAHATLVAVSPAAAALTGITDPVAALGQNLREVIGPLLDFGPHPGPLPEQEVERIPPLLALSSGMMARGLLRIGDRSGGRPVTLDAVSTPLTDGAGVVGSLTFLARI
ncbi:MAG: hypothetical protein FWJ70_11050 [Micromonosporaceae bacterium]